MTSDLPLKNFRCVAQSADCHPDHWPPQLQIGALKDFVTSYRWLSFKVLYF